MNASLAAGGTKRAGVPAQSWPRTGPAPPPLPVSDAAQSSRPEQPPPVLGRLEREAGGGAEQFLCCSQINYVPRPRRGLRGMSSSISTDL